MKIDILTIFPDFFNTPLQTSIVRRAIDGGHTEICVHDLRTHAIDPHKTVDDAPFGGGGGMVLKTEPIASAWDTLKLHQGYSIYLTADGEPLDQHIVSRLSLENRLILLCGHYKGIDERARHFVDREISIGDYVLTGGEPAALVLIDAVVRLIPGVLGNFSSALEDSFHDGLLDCPWYTRPAQFHGADVPTVLLSGDHDKVRVWRRHQALKRTFDRRPEILSHAELDPEERRLVEKWRQEKVLQSELCVKSTADRQDND